MVYGEWCVCVIPDPVNAESTYAFAVLQVNFVTTDEGDGEPSFPSETISSTYVFGLGNFWLAKDASLCSVVSRL